MNQLTFLFFYRLAHQSNFFDHVVIFLGYWLPFLVIAVAGIFLIFFRKSLRECIIVGTSGIAAVIFDAFLKYLIQTPRPFDSLTDVKSLFPETGFAFPSGHATFFMALGIAIFLIHKRAGYVFITFALLIGLARIIAGVHFPIDIFGGFILGGLVSYLVAYFAKNV